MAPHDIQVNVTVASEIRLASLNDPLQREIDLSLAAKFHPLGFPLELATNSRHVMEAAAEAWGSYGPQFERRPLTIHIAVQSEGRLADEPPVFRAQRDVLSIVFDRHNYGVCDRAVLFGYCFVSQATAADHLRLRTHFLEAMTYSLLAQSYVVPMHAACVMREAKGFLLCGASGAGKSTLAYACARAGWTFVSDDAAWLPADSPDRIAIGRSASLRFREDAPKLFPELARYVAEQRPNGKMTIEAPTADLTAIHTAERCPIGHIVLLNRRGGAVPTLQSVRPEEAVENLLTDSPWYGESVYETYRRTLDSLLHTSAWRIGYETLDEALELLSRIP